MSITKRPSPKAIQDFINGAPDAKPDQAPKTKPEKTAISLQLPTDLLARVDEAAAALSLTRSGFIKFVLNKAVSS